MKLIAMKCPACNADISVEEGRTYCFCLYCGSKILIVNENEHVYIHRHVDEAEIRRVEAEQIIKTRQLDLEKQRDLEEIKKRNLSIICGCLFFLVGIVLTILGYSNVETPLVVIGMFMSIFSVFLVIAGIFGVKK